MAAIKHLWLDFSDTIARTNKTALGDIVYSAYASLMGKSVTPELIAEYKELLAKCKSNPAVFASLGQPSGFLADQAAKWDPKELYSLTDEDIPDVVVQLSQIVPVSIFSNNRLDTILPALGLSPLWFKYILGPDEVKSPKPAPEGFLKMVELSGVPASEILYIGDDVEKDIIPAKQAGLLAGLLWTQSSEADYCFDNFRAVLSLLQKEVQ